jgi:hypothetical protein
MAALLEAYNYDPEEEHTDQVNTFIGCGDLDKKFTKDCVTLF